MEYFIVAVLAFAASMLTFFSGFGLGTILTPAFLLFFPLPVAIAMTAMVHFLNNLFKTGLIGGSINKKVLLNFGIPAVIGVIPGVMLLDLLDELPNLMNYQIGNSEFSISWIGIIIGVLMVLFSISEFNTQQRTQPSRFTLGAGGFLSGFFGGLSGHQGALRSGFLIRLNLTKESFVATGVAISLFVDVTRIPMYYNSWIKGLGQNEVLLIFLAIIPAFLGAWLGKRYLKKTSINFVRKLVGFMLILFGILLIAGILN